MTDRRSSQANTNGRFSGKNGARKLAAIIALVILAGGAFITAEITSSKGLWRLTLNAQLQKDKRCRLDDILESRRLIVAGAIHIEGKIRCTDGRLFTFLGGKPKTRFQLKACQADAC